MAEDRSSLRPSASQLASAQSRTLEGAASPAGAAETVTIPLDVARWIYCAWLPLNPNKLRNCDPRLVAAAHAFKAAVEAHGDPRASLAQAEAR